MKFVAIALPVCLVFSLALYAFGPGEDERALLHARSHGAEAKKCLKVIDQDGAPVIGAAVRGGLQTGRGRNDSIPIRGATDINGEYVIEGRCMGIMRCEITKADYYASEFRIDDYGYSHELKDGKWMPYGDKREILLKRIRNPIALVHPYSRHKSVPADGAWHGFDIELWQWMPPHGGGRHADMLVRIKKEELGPSDFMAFMEVSFTNNPFAGAYRLSADSYSEMKSVYAADSNACYKTQFDYLHERHPIMHQYPVMYKQGAKETDTRLDKNSYLVFRTRTRVDANGNLASAHYGIIYGPWDFFRSMVAGNVYFNPIPNDTNLEDLETAERSRRYLRQLDEQLKKERNKK